MWPASRQANTQLMLALLLEGIVCGIGAEQVSTCTAQMFGSNERGNG
jgi:hypothetical protein